MNLIDFKNQSLIKKGDKIVVGLSGGADSVCLLHCLYSLKDISVVACHLNHCLRGSESDSDEQFCIELCKSLNIPLEVFREDCKQYAKAHGLTEEQAGRELRYNFYEQVKQKYSAQKIATAHTASDNAETVIFRLSRGTSLKGLCGIPQKRDDIIRPLLNFTRADIESYCNENNLSYVTDSTNYNEYYSRNKIRLGIIPKLKEINITAVEAICKTADILSDEENYMDSQAKALYEAAKCGEGLTAAKLNSAHIALKRRAVAIFLQKHGLPISNFQIQNICDLLCKVQGKINVSGEYFASLRGGVLYIEKKISFDEFFYELSPGETVISGIGAVKSEICEKKELENRKKVYKNLLYIAADYGKIKGTVSLRSRKDGDKLSLSKRGVTKTVKKLFSEAHLSPLQKSKTVIAQDEKGIVGIFGFDTDRRVNITDETKECLLLVLYKENE